MAAQFEMHVYALNLAGFNDRSLATAVNDVSPNSVILFEDIDCMASGKARVPENPAPERRASKASDGIESSAGLTVTLSGLLNALDGFSAPENVLFVMTSNVVENLDPALLRPGRIDYKLFMGKADESQKVELYKRFFPNADRTEAELFVETNRSVETMAEFQGLLLRFERDCSELDELVAPV
jgi:chaperone BCS1